jgi:hypothetical protein
MSGKMVPLPDPNPFHAKDGGEGPESVESSETLSP